jgi:protein-glucosylgalactosylhydroxylysine glucosidase
MANGYGVGAVNFITGAGGFLQTLLFGFGGLRLTHDKLIINTNSSTPLPHNVTFIYLHQVKYLNASLSFNVSCEHIVIIVNKAPDGDNTLELTNNLERYDLISELSLFCFCYALRI